MNYFFGALGAVVAGVFWLGVTVLNKPCVYSEPIQVSEGVGCRVFKIDGGGCHNLYFTKCENSKTSTEWQERQGKTYIRRQVETQ